MPRLLRPAHARCRGQAMLELAVFGTFMMFGLALIVRFGLQQYFANAASQDAMRLALKEAYDSRAYAGQPYFRPPSSAVRPQAAPGNVGQVLLVKDVYIPDPSDAFGTSGHSSAVSSASVTWGTDRADLDPTTDDELSKPVFQVNDKRLTVYGARFQDATFVYNPATASNVLCRYARAYASSLVVEFYDGAGGWVEADVGLQYCALGGGALISFKKPGATRMVIRVIDNCAGDIVDAETCRDQCQSVRVEGLPVPGYCSRAPISPFTDAPAGLDLLNTTRTHRTNNVLNLKENNIRTESDTTVDETTTIKREIHTSGGGSIDATTTPRRQRHYNWNTKW